MAREYARIRISTADDLDLEELSAEAQWLYFRVLLPHPQLSSCGVASWHPKHLVRKARNASLHMVLRAAAELERAKYLLFDLDTDEVLVRSYVRGDELLRNPKMAGAVIKAYQAVGSRTLQAALVTEIARVRDEHPDYSSWEYKDTRDGLARILSRPSLAAVGYADVISVGYADDGPDEIGYPTSVEMTDAEVDEIGIVDPGPDYQSDSVEIPSTYTLSPQPAPFGGYVAGVRHQGEASDRNEPPPPHCPEHPNGTTDRCGPCGDARRKRTAWETAETRRGALEDVERRRMAAEDRARAMANCNLCDAEGYAGGRVCAHDPGEVDRAKRGSEAVRAALAQRKAATE